jgi:PPK2 family polyphosphate:nucleotide phosphotransferase
LAEDKKEEEEWGIDTDRFRIRPGKSVHLEDWDPDDTSSFSGSEKDAEKESKKLTKKLESLQEMLFAQHVHSVLVVLQGVDTGGKDGTIRHVFEGVNPQGVRVANFKQPTPEELSHDFLWRIEEKVPAKGEIVIFNRSHYEDVLVVRVHKLAPKKVWKHHYEQINDFEHTLSQEGTTILKFFLHISHKEQGKRLRERLEDPTKEWKFNYGDLREREFWPQYMKAYEHALEKTSTDWAPWYLIPANHNWFRDILVSSIIVKTLEGLKMSYPKLNKRQRSIKIK